MPRGRPVGGDVQLGLTSDVPGALPRVIRLMVHCYAGDGREAQHVYLRDAADLRRDLEGAQ